jgi:hypothetical protein
MFEVENMSQQGAHMLPPPVSRTTHFPLIVFSGILSASMRNLLPVRMRISSHHAQDLKENLPIFQEAWKKIQ